MRQMTMSKGLARKKPKTKTKKNQKKKKKKKYNKKVANSPFYRNIFYYQDSEQI